ncbi:YdiU family protein [Flavobacterium gelidilacus]|uniref:protein adenylyltransferase SelO n=1 Tax=Flavobacterium gelidilacus TaxID=206041 RepID=UPI0039EF38BD
MLKLKEKIKNLFTNELPADLIESNQTRQVIEAAFSYVNPVKPKKPSLIHVSNEVAKSLGISLEETKSKEFLNVFTGNTVLENSKPYAMAYAGHQFGNWAGQLGDGRAITLFEAIHNNKCTMFQLKGAGKTPYSRRGDGLAVLRSSIREHLCSEAMYNLGVPTTRSLALFLSGDEVLRDVLYNGNEAYEKGAIVCRTAPSFIRFGNFELFTSREDVKNLQLLTDYTIKHYYPEIQSEGKEKYLEFFEAVADKTREMIVHWQRVGFVHGVMNTDNMSIHGITIDYGPYGWLEDYNPNWTPNTTDNEHKRYRFGNQPQVAQWNLLQLANALFPLIEEVKPLEKILNNFPIKYEADYIQMMHNKLGLKISNEATKNIIYLLTENLELTETDMTIFFRNLSHVSKEDSVENAFEKIKEAFYSIDEVKDATYDTWMYWFTLYIDQLKLENQLDSERKKAMNLVNPKYVLRNYMAQLAIDDADKNDYNLLNELYEILLKPYEEQPQFEKWFAKRPEWAKNKVGCSALSCSS